MRRFSIIIVTMALAFGILFSGCGKNENVHTNNGMKLIENLNYEGALAEFEKAIVKSEDYELTYRGQGIAYMGMSDYDKAIESFEKALQAAGMFPSRLEYDINYYKATAEYKDERFEDAIQTLDAVIKLKEKESDAYFLRGIAKLSIQDEKGARVDFTQALDLNKHRTETVVDIYIAMRDTGYEDLGTAYLKEAINKGSGTLNDYEMGSLCFYLKDYENARNYLEKANSSKEKEKENIVLLLGQAYANLGDYNYASVLYSKYLEKDAKSVEILNQYGLSKMKLGEHEEALKAFQTAIQIKSNSLSQVLRYNEIVAYEKLGQFDQAKIKMEEYLKLYPDDEDAIREYKFLKTR